MKLFLIVILNSVTFDIVVQSKSNLLTDDYTLSHPENDSDVTERPMIHAARRILYASIPVFIFERVRKHKSCASDDKHLPPEYVLMSRSFSR